MRMCSVAEAVAACAGAVRENIRLRRACRLGAGAGVVASYLHASPAPGLGRMGALVRLESASGRLEGAAADVAQVRPAPWMTPNTESLILGEAGSGSDIIRVQALCPIL